MKEYKIKKEPVTFPDGSVIYKWFIYYYVNDEQETRELYSYDGVNPAPGVSIRNGYTEKQK